jgi:hypothetical protein
MRTLEYPEAAIWDLFCRDYPFAKVVSMTTCIASLAPLQADALVRESIQNWAAEGFVERT